MPSPEDLIGDVERAGEEYALFIEVQSEAAFHYRPAPEEWTAAELTGHVAEFPATFGEQARKLSESPGLPLGRSLDDPGRLAAVAKLAGADPMAAAALVRSAIQQALASLQSIAPDGWQATGRHRGLGEISVEEVARRFILDHLRVHLKQARETIGASGEGTEG